MNSISIILSTISMYVAKTKQLSRLQSRLRKALPINANYNNCIRLCENKKNVVNKLKQVRSLIRKIHIECLG